MLVYIVLVEEKRSRDVVTMSDVYKTRENADSHKNELEKTYPDCNVFVKAFSLKD